MRGGRSEWREVPARRARISATGALALTLYLWDDAAGTTWCVEGWVNIGKGDRSLSSQWLRQELPEKREAEVISYASALVLCCCDVARTATRCSGNGYQDPPAPPPPKLPPPKPPKPPPPKPPPPEPPPNPPGEPQIKTFPCRRRRLRPSPSPESRREVSTK